MGGMWRKAVDWLSTSPVQPHVQTREPAYRRPMMMFDGSMYRPVDQVISEMWGGQGRATADEALAVPGVLRARNLIAGTLSTWPVVDIDTENNRHRNPLLEQFDPNVPNVVVRAMIYQDLFFEGVTWARVLAFDTAGFPVSMEHLAPHRVTIQPVEYADGMSPLPGAYVPTEGGQLAQIMVDGVPADHRTIKRFDSPNPGVLKAAGATIKLAAIYRKTATMYANDPRMQGYFTPTEGADPLPDEEVPDLLDVWEVARQKHMTGYVPAALTYNKLENLAPADLQLVQLQEQATREVALACGLEPADLGVSSVTETYSNRVDKRIDRINDVLAPYVTAFDERMSMPDMTRRGHRVYTDPNAFLRGNPEQRIAYYEGMTRLADWTPDDVNDREHEPRRPARPAPAVAPAPDNVTPIRPPGPTRVSASFAADVETFSGPTVLAAADADVGRRLIRGTALPYGPEHTARKNGRRFRFVQGSIVWPDPRHVPLLIDHVQSSSVGHFAAIEDGPAGTTIVARVAHGAAGDQALMWASEEQSVRTGLSVGVEFDADQCVPDPDQPGVWIVPVGAATGKEISLVAVPAYQGARVTSVAMTYGGDTVHCQHCGNTHAPGVACTPAPASAPPAAPAPTAHQFTATDPPTPTPPAEPAYTPQQFAQFAAAFPGMFGQPAPAPEPGPAYVDPTAGRTTAAAQIAPNAAIGATGPRTAVVVSEAIPYRFDFEGNLTAGPEHDLSRDLVMAGRDRDGQAYRRVLTFFREMTVGGRGRGAYQFADVDRADLGALNPTRNRPDMWVPQRDYEYPLVAATRRGTLADSTPFTVPKFSSSTGLVSPHTEGTEPTGGTFVVTAQTITPTARSGALDMTREAWDQGGNPQASALIWAQFTREWNEELESGVGTFLNTQTAAADITITTAAVDGALARAWRGQIARLQFARGGSQRFDMMATEQELYAAFAEAATSTGEPIFPMVGANNRDGSSERRFSRIHAAGVDAVPAWALASTAGAANNSWLFDSQVVHTWDTGPQRLEFPGLDASGNYAPVAYVRMAVWGYQALAVTDISGVRQVIYDTVA